MSLLNKIAVLFDKVNFPITIDKNMNLKLQYIHNIQINPQK